MDANKKIELMTRSLELLAREARSTGQTRVAKICEKAAKELPESSKLKLYEILKS